MKLHPDIANHPNTEGIKFILPLIQEEMREPNGKCRLPDIKNCRIRSDEEFQKISEELFRTTE